MASATLYVGTDISEKVNRTRFYDGSGKEIGARLESVNDLPGSRDLAQEAISRAVLSDAKEILWGLEATNLFWWHLATFLTTHPELLARGLKCYTFNPRQVSKFKESYPYIGKDDWTDAMVIADRLRFGSFRPSATSMSATSPCRGSPATGGIWLGNWSGRRTWPSPTSTSSSRPTP